MNYIILIVSLVFAFSGCQKPPTDEQPISGETAATLGIPVETMVVKRQVVTQNIPLTGILQPIQAVDIAAEVSGTVEKIVKELGQTVTVRDTLAFIDDKVAHSQYQQACAQVLTAQNNLEIARMNLQSDQELYDHEDISLIALENAKLAVKSAEADLLSARAGLELAAKNFRDTRIMSPIDGQISRRYIELGSMVSPGSPTYRIVDLATMKVAVGVPQAMIPNITTGAAANVIVSALGNRTFFGQVRYISPQADETTGTFPVEVHLPNSGDQKLKAGMTARVSLTTLQQEANLVVPDYAVVARDNASFVYIVNGPTARMAEISIGETFGAYVVVTAGLAEGDTIVTVGMNNLGVATQVRVENIQE